jgi:hypothetical protein
VVVARYEFGNHGRRRDESAFRHVKPELEGSKLHFLDTPVELLRAVQVHLLRSVNQELLVVRKHQILDCDAAVEWRDNSGVVGAAVESVLGGLVAVVVHEPDIRRTAEVLDFIEGRSSHTPKTSLCLDTTGTGVFDHFSLLGKLVQEQTVVQSRELAAKMVYLSDNATNWVRRVAMIVCVLDVLATLSRRLEWHLEVLRAASGVATVHVPSW